MSEMSAATDFWGVTTEKAARNKPRDKARTMAKEETRDVVFIRLTRFGVVPDVISTYFGAQQKSSISRKELSSFPPAPALSHSFAKNRLFFCNGCALPQFLAVALPANPQLPHIRRAQRERLARK